MADEYQYPSNIYDIPKNLLAVLGSWWVDQYEGNAQINDIVQAKALVEQQASQDLLELLSAMGRNTVPVYHTDNWYELRLSQKSQTTVTSANIRKYGDNYAYDTGVHYDTIAPTIFYHYPVPQELRSAPIVMNRFTDPDLLWYQGTDFTLTADSLQFVTDPFNDTRVTKFPVYKDGVVDDYIAVLWIYRGQWDWDTVYKQFGYTIQLRMESSEGYKSLLNAAYDTLLKGGHKAGLQQLLSAMTGIPLVRYTGETVTEITRDTTQQLIVTDMSVYALPLTATVTVAVGDVLSKNTSLSTAMEIHELNRGVYPQDLPALALNTGFLLTCMYSDLIFANKDVPLEVITDDPSGFTKLKWPLGGFPLDIEQFFNELHARGVAAALEDPAGCNAGDLVEHTGDINGDIIGESTYVRKATIAHLLDMRQELVGEPTTASLPATINPYRFLLDNVLHKSTAIVILRTAGFNNSGVGLQNLRLLRKILPPQFAVFFIVELQPQADSVTETHFTENVTTWVGATPQADAVTISLLNDRGITVRHVYGAYT